MFVRIKEKKNIFHFKTNLKVNKLFIKSDVYIKVFSFKRYFILPVATFRDSYGFVIVMYYDLD